MDVHPTKNGINRYWSIPILKGMIEPSLVYLGLEASRNSWGHNPDEISGWFLIYLLMFHVCMRSYVGSFTSWIWHLTINSLFESWTLKPSMVDSDILSNNNNNNHDNNNNIWVIGVSFFWRTSPGFTTVPQPIWLILLPEELQIHPIPLNV